MSVATTFVNGAWLDRDGRRLIHDPADTRDLVAEISTSTPSDVDSAYAAAHQAARAWSATGWPATWSAKRANRGPRPPVR